MTFLEPTVEVMLHHISKLAPDAQPLWGSMGPQRMIEHLSDTVALALGEHSFTLSIPEDKVEKAQEFIASEHPMPKNFEVSFAKMDVPLRNPEMALSIDELVSRWMEFEELYENNPGMTSLHPNFGNLNYDQWKRLHSKHITHHFAQFGLI